MSPAAYVGIVCLLERGRVHNFVLPVDIGIHVGVKFILDNQHFYIVVSGFFSAYFHSFVCQQGIVVGANILGQALKLRNREVCPSGDLQFAFLTFFCGNEHHSVSTAHAVNGCCRGVFQDGETLDVGRVNRIDITFETVDKHQRSA